jgi:hypothetical protein
MWTQLEQQYKLSNLQWEIYTLRVTMTNATPIKGENLNDYHPQLDLA